MRSHHCTWVGWLAGAVLTVLCVSINYAAHSRARILDSGEHASAALLLRGPEKER
jgi:hypothetical protein